jgi:hypothetical protein
LKASPITTAAILLAVLIALSIRPIGTADRALNIAFSPSRLVATLTAPLAWIRSSHHAEVNAALQATQEEDESKGLAILDELMIEAMPFQSALRRGRSFVPGQVSFRDKGSKDSLYLAVDDVTGIEIGYPVVHGDAYVGRVGKVEPRKSRLRVDLVTGSDFFVGATVVDFDQMKARNGVGQSTLDLIVGGLDRNLGGPGYLAVHNPSVREFRSGLVVVKEPDLFADASTYLADGYLLGSLTRLLGDEGPWSVEPLRNFDSGLFHLVVVLPEATVRKASIAAPTALRDGNWQQVKLLSRGEPEAGRSGIVIGAGSLHGVSPGAAVIASARLLGRVDTRRAGGPLTARVHLLDEPGLRVHAVAQIDEGEHRGEVHVLGELISLGPIPGAEPGIAFQWDASIRLDGRLNVVPDETKDETKDETEDKSTWLAATLYTGTGLVGLPGGLYLGRARLPLSVATHRIVLTDSTQGQEPSRLFVRVDESKSGAKP